MTRYLTTLVSTLALALSLAAMNGAWAIHPHLTPAIISNEPTPLLRTVPALHFQGIRLDQAVDEIARTGRARIDVNWDRLEDHDIDPARPVVADLEHVSVIGAIETVFDLARGNNGRRLRIKYYVDHNVIHIDQPSRGTDWIPSSHPAVVRMYDIRSLLTPSYRPPQPGEDETDIVLNQLFSGSPKPAWQPHFTDPKQEIRYNDLAQELANVCDIDIDHIGYWAGRMVVIADQQQQATLNRILRQMSGDERAIEQNGKR